jgi:hypothetical protein
VPAIFGNCGTLASFRVSGDDAVILAKEFASDVIATQLENLPDFDLYLRTLIYSEGSNALMASQAQRITAYAPLQNNKDAQESRRVVRASFERYTQPRAGVDEWLSRTFTPPERKEAAPKKGASRRKKVA